MVLFGSMAISFAAIWLTAPDPTRWVLLLMVGVGGANAGGMVLPGLAAYLFPARLLSSAVGMGVLVARLGAFAGPPLGAAMIAGQVPAQTFLGSRPAGAGVVIMALSCRGAGRAEKQKTGGAVRLTRPSRVPGRAVRSHPLPEAVAAYTHPAKLLFVERTIPVECGSIAYHRSWRDRGAGIERSPAKNVPYVLLEHMIAMNQLSSPTPRTRVPLDAFLTPGKLRSISRSRWPDGALPAGWLGIGLHRRISVPLGSAGCRPREGGPLMA